MRERLAKGFSYAFGGLLGDIGGWLLIGIGVAGVISYFVPSDFFAHHARGEFSSLFLMLAVGIPLYVCATASTPIAAALVLKGLSPGAALVLLLAGPATNAATLTVVAKLMGKRTAALYLAAIAVCSVALGWMVNQVYYYLGMDVSRWVAGIGESGDNPLAVISSAVLLILVARSTLPRWSLKRSHCGCEVPAK
jgi:uncharacterized membrane protein YraQ (UPF0718 family)